MAVCAVCRERVLAAKCQITGNYFPGLLVIRRNRRKITNLPVAYSIEPARKRHISEFPYQGFCDRQQRHYCCSKHFTEQNIAAKWDAIVVLWDPFHHIWDVPSVETDNGGRQQD